LQRKHVCLTQNNSKGKENIFSRAYFHFKTMEAVVAFHQGFDGHMFIDSRGKGL
jgi:regulator of nonsense transcripts 3